MSMVEPIVMLNVLLALMLAGAIAYVAWLARRLRTWREEAAELRRLIASFDASIERAEQVLAELKQVAHTDSGAAKRTEALRDDLAFLMERGAGLADRLEHDLRLALVRNAERPAAASRARRVAGAQLRLVKGERAPRLKDNSQ